MAQNGTDLRLTKKQKEVAELLANPDIKMDKTRIMQAVDVPRTTFYRWLRDEKFIKYVASLVDAYTDAELSEVWKSLLKRCADGAVDAIKLYFEMKGKYSQNINFSGEVIKIINDIPKGDGASETSD